jgi:dienelactone hydrolase
VRRVIERFSQFPRELAAAAQTARLGPSRTPALLVHPTWESPAPVVLWMHGRTAYKELDPGRYLRWMRAGIAACAVDLPGHGERADPVLQTPQRTLQVLAQMHAEVDGVVAALGASEYQGIFDLSRIALGGMSLGGMVTLRRLCDAHTFACAAVEGTSGWLRGLYQPPPDIAAETAELLPERDPRWLAAHAEADVDRLDPLGKLAGFRPIPLLALHNTFDAVVPLPVQSRFLSHLRAHYASGAADPSRIELVTFDKTGAPQEHSGFGRFSNDAKNTQTAFLQRWLVQGQ